MPGLDNDLIMTLKIGDKVVYEGPVYWDWDDDDEDMIRIMQSVPKPSEYY